MLPHRCGARGRSSRCWPSRPTDDAAAGPIGRVQPDPTPLPWPKAVRTCPAPPPPYLPCPPPRPRPGPREERTPRVHRLAAAELARASRQRRRRQAAKHLQQRHIPPPRGESGPARTSPRAGPQTRDRGCPRARRSGRRPRRPQSSALPLADGSSGERASAAGVGLARPCPGRGTFRRPLRSPRRAVFGTHGRDRKPILAVGHDVSRRSHRS